MILMGNGRDLRSIADAGSCGLKYESTSVRVCMCIVTFSNRTRPRVLSVRQQRPIGEIVWVTLYGEEHKKHRRESSSIKQRGATLNIACLLGSDKVLHGEDL